MSTEADFVTRAREIVHRILYVTIASASAQGRPWNAPVYSAFDDDGNFYWTSTPEATHSQNVEANGEVALVVYDSTVPEGTGEGVYVAAAATVLYDVDAIAIGRRNLARRVGKPKSEDAHEFTEGSVRRVYRATPTGVWMNSEDTDDDGNYVRDTRVKLPLDTLRNLTTWN